MQDLTMFFGSDRGRFYEVEKRAVQDKFLGVFIKTIMTRCIHCTRCVRFLQEISDDFALGLTGRGSLMEITTYIKNSLHKELSGNIIDLCPVGALTSKPYAFKARPWEAKQIYSIDIFDSVCSSIRMDVFNNKVLRIMPISNSFINEDWITNKIRFCYDSFNIQRLTAPLYKIKDKVLLRVSWRRIFKYLSLVLFQSFVKQIESRLSDSMDLISLQIIKDFFTSYGNSNFISNTYIKNVDFRSNYLLNTSLYSLEFLDLVIMVGVNARLEFPLLNLRLRKRYLKSNDFLVYNFGLGLNYFTFPVINAGNLSSYLNLIFGKNSICKKIFKVQNSKLFLGKSILSTLNFKFISNLSQYCLRILNKFEGFISVLENQPGLIGAYDLGMFSSVNSQCFNTEFLFNSFILYFIFNISDFSRFIKSKYKFVVYLGSYGNNSIMSNANIVLPTSIFSETESIFINIEGFAQISNAALSLIGDSRDMNSIFKALYLYLNLINSLTDLTVTDVILKNTFQLTFIGKTLSISKRLIEVLPIFKYSKFYFYFINFDFYNNIYLKFLQKLNDETIYNFYKTSNDMLENSLTLNAVKNMNINSF